MRTFGIICEYDPFHLGHQKQLRMIRNAYPDARIICLMSGPFTQRGAPALFSPRRRARQALLAGADLVLELPTLFAVNDADHFAAAGIEILNKLSCVDTLSFGCEGDIESIRCAAAFLENPSEAYQSVLARRLSEGAAFSTARGAALEACLPGLGNVINKPNNILAVSYLRAMLRSGSRLEVFPVKREGNYHDRELAVSGNSSATAIRSAFLSGATELAGNHCGYSLAGWECCKPDALDPLLLWTLRIQSPEQLSHLPYCTEGLENRLHRAALESTSREILLEKLKTKRYSYARLSRLCCHAMLGITQETLCNHPVPEYVRILAIRPDRMLHVLDRADIPIIAKIKKAEQSNPLLRIDEKAYDLWALGSNSLPGLLYKEQITVL